MRESKVEAYLVKQVEARGGLIRKVSWIGRRGAPDRFVLMPDEPNFWAELKRPGKDAEAHQAREHARLRRYGERVYVLDSFEAIDKALIVNGMF